MPGATASGRAGEFGAKENSDPVMVALVICKVAVPVLRMVKLLVLIRPPTIVVPASRGKVLG